ncbi:MAG: dethiobiotin synthase [Desulfobulbaceae bacterium]|nr:dethiobiotin synthase [Desulfobulbaceae bacterium]
MKICNYLPQQFVIVGTDTGVGKTFVAALLATGLDASYWKPIQSGLEEVSDTELVRYLSGLPSSSFLPESYRLSTPISPHASAAIDGVTIEMERLCLPQVKGRLIVEGAGGVMVPINDDLLLIDVLCQWGLPVLLVGRSLVGTINHTLLTLAALSSYGIAVVGVVMNGGIDTVSRRAIEKYGKVKVLAEVPFFKKLEGGTLKPLFDELFAGENF